MDFHKIDEKWQEKWEKAKIFEAEVEPGEKKFFITVAYPYPSGGMHLGHARTYLLPEIIARFKKMQGFDVLFPFAFQPSGTPIVGAAKRLKEGDKNWLRIMKEIYNVPDQELKKLYDPIGFANYFIDGSKEWSYYHGLRALGSAIDWSRRFTTIDPHYMKFITWQFNILGKKKLLEKGEYRVKYCPKDKNPVTDHDLLYGVGADILEFSLIKFRLKDIILPCATLRPETTFGVTNIWINPDVKYVEAVVDKEKWIISKEAVKKLEFLDKKVEIKREFPGKELLGKKVKNPVTGDNIPILPASFVDSDNGSGVVMSVPAHAPYDYMALKDLEKDKKYGPSVKKIKPISLIEVEGYGEFPATEICKKIGIVNQKDPELEHATNEIYKHEFSSGILKDNTGKYAGMKVFEVKNKLREDFIKKNFAEILFEFSKKPVQCRCGSKVFIKKVKNQWFIKYYDKNWKELAKECLKGMRLIPEETRKQYLQTIDWLDKWPCVRHVGLGTPFPFDKSLIIESLSDSTIYMAYYTIDKYIKNIDPEKFTSEVFDYIFFGKGKLEGFNDKEKKLINAARLSFAYFYPLDFRCSADELIPNHLTFFIFHHSTIFPKVVWPKGIATFGMVLLEGNVMSSSKGRAISPVKACKEYGADVIRFYLFSRTEPWQILDWKNEEAKTFSTNLSRFYELTKSIISSDIKVERSNIDKWLVSRLQRSIKNTTEALENFETRKAAQSCFFDLMNDLKWYTRRKKINEDLIEVANVWIRLMAPFTPHICEELWSDLGKDTFVSIAEWPKADEKLISPHMEAEEELLKQTMSDIEEIKKISKIERPSKITIFIAPQWKYEVYNSVVEGLDIKGIMTKKEYKEIGKNVSDYFVKLQKRKPVDELFLSESSLLSTFENAKSFLEKEFDCKIEILRAEKTSHPKASMANPNKPGILVE